MTSNTEQSNNELSQNNTSSQATDIESAALNDALSQGSLSPAENVINDLVSRMTSLEEQLATDGCNIADVETQLSMLQTELTAHLNGIEPALAQEAMADEATVETNLGTQETIAEEGIDVAASDGTLNDGIVSDLLEAAEESQGDSDDSAGDDTQSLAQNTAQDLASIEPAAGEGAQSSGATTNGFGFQSTFAAGPIDGLEDVGPIDPTQLEFGIEFQNEEVRPLEEEEEPIPAEDDNPLIIRPDALDLDETNLSINQNGTIDVDFGNDGAGSIQSTDTFTASGSLTNDTLTSGGVNVDVQRTPNGFTGTANGQDVFTLTIDPQTGDYTFNQILPLDHQDGSNPNDVITLEFGVEVSDSDGDTATSLITINVADDAPSNIEPTTARVDETNLAPSTSVSGTINVDFGNDGVGSVQSTESFTASGSLTNDTLTSGGVNVDVQRTPNGFIGTANGQDVFTLTINPQTGDYTFNQILPLDHQDGSNPNDVITLQFGVEVSDSDGDTALTSITINVADDAPISIEPETARVDETNLAPNTSASGTINANFGNDGAGSISGNGSNTIGDLKSNGHDVVVIYDASASTYTGTANGQDVFTLSISDNGAYEFELTGTLDHPDTGNHNDVLNLQFGIQATDSDGDSIDGNITIKVADDGPTAHDDLNTFNIGDNDIDGNVITGENGGAGASDGLSADLSNTVTKISFGDQSIDVTPGRTATIDGEFGSLDIAADGSYSYELFDAPKGDETIYSFSKDNPPGSDRAGDIKNVNTTYNSSTNEFSFSMKIEDSAEGFTLAINDGPNPKGHGGEMALFYFDASGTQPVVSVYAYNGLNTQTSWQDGGKASGIQDPDQILSSLSKNNPFTSITVTTDANGDKVMSFSLDVTDIINHSPEYGIASDWSGVSFNEQIGMWLHPSSNLTAEYNTEGFLTDWNVGAQSYYDSANQTAEVEIIQAQPTRDEFEYTLQDGDGDTSTATLTLVGDENTKVAQSDAFEPEQKPQEEAIEDPAQKEVAAEEPEDHDVDEIVVSDEPAETVQDTPQETKSEPINLKEEWDRSTAETNNEGSNAEDVTAPEIVETSDQDEAEPETENTNNEIYAQGNDDTLYGSADNDAPSTGNPEHSEFVCLAVSQGIGVIRDFGADPTDVLDFSQLIQSYDPAQQAIDNFVFAREVDGGTILSIDTSGSGDATQAVDLIALEGLQDMNLQDLVESGNINVM